MIGFELVGGLVAERLVSAFWIVKGFDVLEHAELGFFEVVELSPVGPLVFEAPEEAFHDGVVVAVARAAHRALDAERQGQHA